MPLFLEYGAVLMRPRFRLETGYPTADLTGFPTDLAAVIEPVELFLLWRPQLADPEDEMVIETAVNGAADRIVTHDIRDFRDGATRFGIPVVRPLDRLGEQTR